MKKRLLLASDFDGTVGVGDQLQRDRDAIARFREAGHLFGLVSGRNAAGLKEMRQKTALPCDFLLSDNGSVCYLPKKRENGKDPFEFEENSPSFDPFCGGKLLFYHAGAEELFFPLADFLLERGSKMVAVNDQKGAELLYLEESGRIRASIPRECWIARSFSQMSGLFERTEDAHAAARQGEERFPQLVGLVSDCLDFLPRGRDKAVGLAELAGLLGVEKEEVFTVGDNFNDLAMLRAFHGFAVENAPKEVKLQAKEGEIPTLAHLIDLLLSRESADKKGEKG